MSPEWTEGGWNGKSAFALSASARQPSLGGTVAEIVASATRWPSRRSSRWIPARAKADGGERGIRTPGGVSPTVVFKTTAIDHSAISPRDGTLISSSVARLSLFRLRQWREVLFARSDLHILPVCRDDDGMNPTVRSRRCEPEQVFAAKLRNHPGQCSG